MKNLLCMVLSLLLILVAFSACKNEDTNPTTANRDYLSDIMEAPGEHPQLTKEEFLEITKNYLATNEWSLPSEKACFYTYGVNYCAYIIENEYLFSLYTNSDPDGSAAYEFSLSRFADGAVTESETDPLLFESFLN